MLAVRFEPAPGNPQRFMQALRAAGVVADRRRPDGRRVTPRPRYNTVAEVVRAGGALERALAA
jgi:kynureninase